MHSQASESTSRSLLERARKRDPLAWQRLTDVYGPLVYQWCRRANLQAGDAADVMQEVFQSVFQSLDRFQKTRPEDSFRGWLWTITRNKIRDYYRAHGDQPVAQGGSSAQQWLQQFADDDTSDAHEANREPQQAWLAQRAVALLHSDFEESTWQAFWLTGVEQQPAEAVAQQLGISLAAVYKAKSRVLRRLREELDGLDLME
jgi:RNA polymerase sigma-70 factor (ECF subfamily)